MKTRNGGTALVGSVILFVALISQSTFAQYDGYWRNVTTANNVPRFNVSGGQVTNLYSSLSYVCGGSTYYTGGSSTSIVSIVGNSFSVSLTAGYASYTFTGYFVSGTLCTGRYSYVSTGCGGGGFSSGNWSTAKVGPDPIISVTPSSSSFGTVAVGSSSNRTFTVQNVGGGTLAGTASGLSAPFSIVSNSSYSIGSFSSTSIVVQFSPGAAGSYTQTVAFTGGAGTTREVTGNAVSANDAPTNIILSATNIAENLPIGTTVGSFSSQDPNAGNTFTYSLVAGTGSGDNGSFSISSSNLQTAAIFNYEVKSNYSIRIQSTDQGSLSTQKVFAIRVTDMNEPPPSFSDAPSPSGSNMVIRWGSITNKKYTVHYSTNLITGFSVLQSNIPGTPAVNSYTDTLTVVTQKYWKVTTDP